MVNSRQDGWSHDEDSLLAETVLTYIKSGSTQLKAFEEVGRKLSRTAAACGFRWNSCVRKQYQEQIHQAKLQRHPTSDIADNFLGDKGCYDCKIQSDSQATEINFETCLEFLQTLAKKLKEYQLEDIEAAAHENQQLRKKVALLARERDNVEKQCTEIREDYKTLLSYFEKARKLALSDTTEVNRTRFQMDQNGNLERV